MPTYSVRPKMLEGTELLTIKGDIAEQMIMGIDRYLMRELKELALKREENWKRDFTLHENYVNSIKVNRQHFQKIIGANDPREPVEMQLFATTSGSGLVGEGNGYRAFAVRWNVLTGVDAEGLLLQPDEKPIADIVALPDCDWMPEMLTGLVPGIPVESQFARRLAESGCRVLVPTLIDRKDTYSGNAKFCMTNQPHREFIYRASYELGRHIIGYEVLKVLAAIDWFVQDSGERPIGVIGYGEGGLVAFYSAAVDTRIRAASVSGYFQPREEVWREPIYRNIWSLLTEFGDAEIASLIAPRPLIIEACRHPEIKGPPQTPNRSGASPGTITSPSISDVKREVERARILLGDLKPLALITLVKNENGLAGSANTLSEFLNGMGLDHKFSPSGKEAKRLFGSFNPEKRIRRQFLQLLEHTQRLMRDAEFRRAEFWSKIDESSVEAWQMSTKWYRQYLWDEVIGKLPPANVDANPRTRLIYDESDYRGYEVMLDVYTDVFAYGILLVPKGIKPGERRSLVVCQHGLEGRPQHVADPKFEDPSYHRFACKLAERGYVTYAPQNPYIGGDNFRVLQRKANPLKKSIFSFIVRQHERTIEWLSGLPFVDPMRIAFYGLSYGGKTAMRVPALLERYCLSICSADYNEWIWKNVDVQHRYSYLFTGEYEMPEFDLGNTFNYAELSWLICPRPFMVERGHHDGVAPDEWVAYEYAKTKRRYDLLDIGNRTDIEFFNGPHTINGMGTFEFLDRYLMSRKVE